MDLSLLPQWIKRTDARHKCPVEDPDYHKEELFFRDVVRRARAWGLGGSPLTPHLLGALFRVQTGEGDWNKPQCCVCAKKIEEASYECRCCKVRAWEPGITVPKKAPDHLVQYDPTAVVPNARLTPRATEQFSWKNDGKDVCIDCAAVTAEEKDTKALLAGKAVLACSGEKGTTTLGVNSGDVDVVKAFVQAGGDVNMRVPPKDGVGESMGREEPILLRAARWGHADICAVLVEAGADLSVSRRNFPQDGLRGDAIETAAANGHVLTIKALLGAGWVAKVGKPLGAAVLKTAVERGNQELVDALLAAGVPITDPNEGAGNQPTARIWCEGRWNNGGSFFFRGCNAALVKKLLAAGAPAEGLWLDSNSYMGINAGGGEMMNYSYLGMACRDADVESAKLLIDAGALISADVISAGLVCSGNSGRDNRPMIEYLLKGRQSRGFQARATAHHGRLGRQCAACSSGGARCGGGAEGVDQP